MLKTYCFAYIFLITLEIGDLEVVQCPSWCGNGVLNTACARGNCEPAEECTEIKMTDKYRQWFTRSHNLFRDRIAINEMVANMLILSYNKDLEYMAQCWANACKFQKDRCRLITAFPERVGQNVAMKMYVKTEDHIERIVEKWMRNGTSDTRWAQTSHLGCGMSKIDFGRVILVCNYGVPGGALLDYGYRHGHTTTMCNPGQRSHHEYTNLCTLGKASSATRSVLITLYLISALIVLDVFINIY